MHLFQRVAKPVVICKRCGICTFRGSPSVWPLLSLDRTHFSGRDGALFVSELGTRGLTQSKHSFKVCFNYELHSIE